MIPKTETVSPPRLIGLAEVMHQTSLSEPTIRRMVETDRFPKPIKISTKRIAWLEADVIGWINEKVAA